MEIFGLVSPSINDIVSSWYHKLSLIDSSEVRQLVSLSGCPVVSLPLWGNIDDAVVHIIISQMLSFKAANAIISRLTSNFTSSSDLLAYISSLNTIERPFYGISVKKQKALLFWYTSNARNGSLSFKPSCYSDVYNYFSSLWGFGSWSIDMLSIFYYCLPDVWPSTDVNIIKYCNRYFNGIKPQSISGLESIVSLCIWNVSNKGLF